MLVAEITFQFHKMGDISVLSEHRQLLKNSAICITHRCLNLCVLNAMLSANYIYSSTAKESCLL